MASVFDKPLTGFRFVEILFGDTLQKIAARELGDAKRWPDLIAYNNLKPPYVTDDPTLVKPGVLLSGSQLLVPAPTATISAATDPDLVFETDIDLTGGFLHADNGDLAVLSGRENLKQALKHRIDTERGELIFHSEYGSLIRRLIGAVNGPTAGLLASEYAKSAMLADPRVSSVTEAVSEVTSDQIVLGIEVQAISGKPVQIETTL